MTEANNTTIAKMQVFMIKRIPFGPTEKANNPLLHNGQFGKEMQYGEYGFFPCFRPPFARESSLKSLLNSGYREKQAFYGGINVVPPKRREGRVRSK